MIWGVKCFNKLVYLKELVFFLGLEKGFFYRKCKFKGYEIFYNYFYCLKNNFNIF